MNVSDTTLHFIISDTVIASVEVYIHPFFHLSRFSCGDTSQSREAQTSLSPATSSSSSWMTPRYSNTQALSQGRISKPLLLCAFHHGNQWSKVEPGPGEGHHAPCSCLFKKQEIQIYDKHSLIVPAGFHLPALTLNYLKEILLCYAFNSLEYSVQICMRRRPMANASRLANGLD